MDLGGARWAKGHGPGGGGGGRRVCEDGEEDAEGEDGGQHADAELRG